MTGRGRAPAAVVLAVIVLAALAARAAAYTGQSFSFGSDESRFIAVAQNLTNGAFPSGETEWFGTRLGLIWPVAGLFQVLPPGDLTAALWPLAGSLLAVVAAFLCGRELASTRVGLVAAALVAIAPLEALVGMRLRPDALVPGVIALAVWLALRARRARAGPAFLAGLVLGAAWSIRENAVLLAPVLVVAGLGAGRRALAAGLAGLAVVPLVSAAVFAAGAGAPLRPLIGAGTEGEWRNPVTAFDWDATYLARIWDGVVDPGSPFLLLVPVAVGAIAVILYRRDRRALLPGLWLGWTALYLEFGTLMNLAKPVRYLTLCAVPLALLVALAVDGRFAWVAPAALVAVTAAALWSVPGRDLRDDDSLLVGRVADRLRALPPGPVFTESYTWWAKLRTYTARERLDIPPARDPEFADADEVRAARTLTPVPDPSVVAGGYLVTGPVHPRAGWPLNWPDARSALATIPRDRLQAVAVVDGATIWRWSR